MEFSFFQTDNKSGYKTKEKWFSKNYPEEYDKIIEYSKKFNFNKSFKEKIWVYFNHITERPKCLTCGNEIIFRERFDNPYGEFCSIKCLNSNRDEMIRRQKKTFNEKYNVDFYPSYKEFVKKQKETKLQRYGDENFNNILKSKKTKLEKYGDEKFNNTEKNKETCLLKYGEDNYSKTNNFKNRSIELFKLKYPNLTINNVNGSIVQLACEKCNNEYVINKQMLYERTKRNQNPCIICNPYGQKNKSSYENEISKFLTQLSVNHQCSYRGLTSGKEIDIFINDKKIGIEINGLYWHNENFVSEDYHLNKTNECKSHGIKLIHIFEDEWLYKKEIVKSIIKNKLKLTDNTIYARKCVIKEIDSKISSGFLKNNHIQGSVNSKVKLGLFYNDNLVSVMTFSRGRIIMGGKSQEWELNRFANILNTTVIGGASKLMSYFIKKYNPQLIVSYSDVRLFDGQLYKSLLFQNMGQSLPNYWYVIGNNRYHRFNFRKSILIKNGFNKDKTEKEIMYERKIFRIYDCGNIRWEYSLKN